MRIKYLLIVVFCSFVSLGGALDAAEVEPGEFYQLFSSGKFSDIAKGIDLVARSELAHKSDLLEALQKRRLYFTPNDTLLFFQSGDQFLDARTGQPLANIPDAKKKVRVNNRVRGLVKKVQGTLTLESPDAGKRLEAALSLFKSRDKKNLGALEQALKKEPDASIRGAMEQARAAILIADADTLVDQKLEAITVLASQANRDAIPLLRAASASSDEEIKSAALQGIRSIERQLKFMELAQNVWYGLSLGSVLLLAAIGLAITFGVMGVINMAHGEMVMIGAYTTFVVQEYFRSFAPDYFDWSLPLAIPCAFVCAALVGIAIERGIIRFLYGRPLETLLATWGVSLILQQAVRTIFGPTNREVGAPSYMSGSFDFLGLSITYGRLWIIVFTLFVFACLLLILRMTPLGLQMRAVTQNRRMASAMGIRTGWVDALTFGLGSGIAGVAGVALSQIDNVSPNLGQTYIIDSFLVVVFGGVGNLWGTLVSAMTLGIANKFMEPLTGAVLGKILILVLVILFIQKRPRGLFALKGRAVEA